MKNGWRKLRNLTRSTRAIAGGAAEAAASAAASAAAVTRRNAEEAGRAATSAQRARACEASAGGCIEGLGAVNQYITKDKGDVQLFSDDLKRSEDLSATGSANVAANECAADTKVELKNNVENREEMVANAEETLRNLSAELEGEPGGPELKITVERTAATGQNTIKAHAEAAGEACEAKQVQKIRKHISEEEQSQSRYEKEKNNLEAILKGHEAVKKARQKQLRDKEEAEKEEAAAAEKARAAAAEERARADEEAARVVAQKEQEAKEAAKKERELRRLAEEAAKKEAAENKKKREEIEAKIQALNKTLEEIG